MLTRSCTLAYPVISFTTATILPPSQAGVTADQAVLYDLLELSTPSLRRSLVTLGGTGQEAAMSTLRWFVSLFTNPFNPVFSSRVWDALLFDGRKVLFRTALSLLRMVYLAAPPPQCFSDAMVLLDGLGDRVNDTTDVAFFFGPDDADADAATPVNAVDGGGGQKTRHHHNGRDGGGGGGGGGGGRSTTSSASMSSARRRRHALRLLAGTAPEPSPVEPTAGELRAAEAEAMVAVRSGIKRSSSCEELVVAGDNDGGGGGSSAANNATDSGADSASRRGRRAVRRQVGDGDSVKWRDKARAGSGGDSSVRSSSRGISVTSRSSSDSSAVTASHSDLDEFDEEGVGEWAVAMDRAADVSVTDGTVTRTPPRGKHGGDVVGLSRLLLPGPMDSGRSAVVKRTTSERSERSERLEQSDGDHGVTQSGGGVGSDGGGGGGDGGHNDGDSVEGEGDALAGSARLQREAQQGLGSGGGGVAHGGPGATHGAIVRSRSRLRVLPRGGFVWLERVNGGR